MKTYDIKGGDVKWHSTSGGHGAYNEFDNIFDYVLSLCSSIDF